MKYNVAVIPGDGIGPELSLIHISVDPAVRMALTPIREWSRIIALKRLLKYPFQIT